MGDIARKEGGGRAVTWPHDYQWVPDFGGGITLDNSSAHIPEFQPRVGFLCWYGDSKARRRASIECRE